MFEICALQKLIVVLFIEAYNKMRHLDQFQVYHTLALSRVQFLWPVARVEYFPFRGIRILEKLQSYSSVL